MRDETLETVPEPIDVEPETQALTVRPQEQVATQPQVAAPVTAAQAKIEAVAHLTHTAYERASMLQLSPEESRALEADFPDDAFQPGAAGKENLIYIEHAALRQRLSSVFGVGQWTIVPRSRWSEKYRTYKGVNAERVYVEAMLLVRGCFVAEAVGDMSYYPNNDSQNYGDAVEGAKTAAFRRCAKELGVGLQAWKKDWCNGWWQRRNAAKAPGKPPTAPSQSSPSVAPSKPAPASISTGNGEQTFPVVTVLTVKEVHSKPNAPKVWTAYFIKFSDGFGEMEAATFDRKVADLANDLSNTQENAVLVTRPGCKEGSKEIVSLKRAEQPPAEDDNVPMNFDAQGNPIQETIP